MAAAAALVHGDPSGITSPGPTNLTRFGAGVPVTPGRYGEPAAAGRNPGIAPPMPLREES